MFGAQCSYEILPTLCTYPMVFVNTLNGICQNFPRFTGAEIPARHHFYPQLFQFSSRIELLEVRSGNVKPCSFPQCRSCYSKAGSSHTHKR